MFSSTEEAAFLEVSKLILRSSAKDEGDAVYSNCYEFFEGRSNKWASLRLMFVVLEPIPSMEYAKVVDILNVALLEVQAQ